ncbi:GAF domain-containing protein [Sphingomonas sp. AP4-R1]|uniref:sensor histidine kinase n=1 Tax=Sphingomonas sp. AP4-R1 TaxID=2735134 RepID=UPI001493DABA|nr:GAF domain-containing protein [Sphingomonas sp. AP4-R1]QJU59316.1 GAF domain-containing protein [Sphingomonas sp. AP4-R1]
MARSGRQACIKERRLPSTHAPVISSDLLLAERDILARVARGGPLAEVLTDIVLLAESPTNGQMLASVLLVSDDGRSLLEGAAPSLPKAYNAAVHGIPIGHGIGSCGTAAASGKPIIVTDIAVDPLWADYRDLALGFDLRACWSMPIEAADGRLLGTFANYYREPREPTERDLELISMAARTTAIAVERHINDLERERAEEQRMLVVRELNHRVKNVFALVQSLLAMSARSATSVEAYAQAVQGRMSALSRAHELVQPGLSLDDLAGPCDVALREIFADILAPYLHDDITEKVVLTGGDEQVSPHAITGLSLILHELATNAAKYGALSKQDGRLRVSWQLVDDLVEIVWSERGGPRPTVPTQTGFGSTLIKRTVERQFLGTIDRDWRPEGLDVRLRLSVGRFTKSL